MGKIIDITGQRFNRLVAIKPLPKDPNIKDRCIRWLCQCDCGNEVIVSSGNLKSGHTQSCGCLQKEKARKRLIDITGNEYGKLIVIGLDKEASKNHQHTYWKCKCDCGGIVSVDANSLKKGLTKSCGCLKQSYGTLLIDNILNKNNIPFKKEYYCKDKDNNKFYFDYLIKDTYIIEFDGQQHFKSTAGWNSHEQVLLTHKKDLIKNKYCFENNIPLIRIPYCEQNDIKLENLILESSQFILNKGNEKQYYLKYYKEENK